MSKLCSVDVQLQLCEGCKRSDRLKVIGTLSFCTHCILDRVNWMTFRGKFEGTVDVAVRRIHKGHGETKIITTVESETLRRVVVRHYITEQDDDFWYVNLSYETKDNIIKIRN